MSVSLRRGFSVLVAGLVLLCGGALPAGASSGDVRLVSGYTINLCPPGSCPTNVFGNGGSGTPSTNFDGRVVAFASDAANLPTKPKDSGKYRDVFVKDMSTGKISLVSTTSSGLQKNGNSDEPAINGSGRYVAFSSFAALVPEDTNGVADVYRKDLSSGQIVRVSVAGVNTQADGGSFQPSISENGNTVAFASLAKNLGGGAQGNANVYVRDIAAKTTVLVSVNLKGKASSAWSWMPSVSANGARVAFTSSAVDLDTKPDVNGGMDVFVRNVSAKKTIRVSVTPQGAAANDWSWDPSINGDGTKVAFTSKATDLDPPKDTWGYDQVYLASVSEGSLPAVVLWSIDGGSGGDGDSDNPSISKDGWRVVYASDAVFEGDTADTDIYVHQYLTGPELVSVQPDGDPVSGTSTLPSISGDSKFVTYQSTASDILGGDKNGTTDVFRHEL